MKSEQIILTAEDYFQLPFIKKHYNDFCKYIFYLITSL